MIEQYPKKAILLLAINITGKLRLMMAITQTTHQTAIPPIRIRATTIASPLTTPPNAQQTAIVVPRIDPLVKLIPQSILWNLQTMQTLTIARNGFKLGMTISKRAGHA